MITPDDLKVLRDRILQQKLNSLILCDGVRFLLTELKAHEIWDYQELRDAQPNLSDKFVLEFTSGIVSDGPTIIEQPESDLIAFIVDSLCLCGIRSGEEYLKTLDDCEDYIKSLSEIGQSENPYHTTIVMGFGAMTIATGTPPSDLILNHMFFNLDEDEERYETIVAIIDEICWDRVRRWAKTNKHN